MAIARAYKRLVEIEWLDTVRETSTWVLPNKLAKPARCYTVGWILAEHKDYIVIAGTIGEKRKHTVGDVNSIPRGCIVNIRELSNF